MMMNHVFVIVSMLASALHAQGGCAWVGPNATCPAHCTWNCALNLCYDATCPQFATAATCQSVSGCTWANNQCRDYNLQYGSFPSCALAQTQATCGGNCAWSMNQGKCIAKQHACAWAPQKSPTSCPDKCTYGQAIGYCYDKTCDALSTPAQCSAQGGCSWYNGYCYDYNLQYSGFACSRASEPSECPSSRCHWDAELGVCANGGVPAGSTLPPLPAPTSSPGGCAWVSNPTAATCPSHCTFDAQLNRCYDATCIFKHTPASCASVNGCSWSRNLCRDYNVHYGQMTCANSQSQLTCGGNQCQWKWSALQCIAGGPSQACAWLQQGSAGACPDRCSFNSLTGNCFETTCAAATTPCACSVLSNAGCSWYNNRCRDYNVQYGSYACSNAKSLAECGRSCTWNAATSTCSA